MTLENNRKILIGSLMQSLDKKLMLGETDDTPIILLSLLVDHLEFALSQQEAGVSSFNEIVQNIYAKILILKNQCPDICFYKNRLIVFENNTAPTIENNTIVVPFEGTTVLPYNEVIHQYNDAENNLISKVVVISQGDGHEIFIDNSPLLINNEYSPSIEFSANYKLDEDYLYITKNTSSDPVVVKVLKDSFDQALDNGTLLEVNEISQELIFQTLTNSTETLPNDTIIYIHIDTSSMVATDQVALKTTALAWWDQFKIDNPDFAGSLLINTVNNDVMDPTGTSPGRSFPIILNISDSPNNLYETNVEQWLATPTMALLRQAYKEGLNTFPTEADFLAYIQNKSVIAIAFVDETNNAYHGTTVNMFGQPFVDYSTDYNNFVNIIHPQLKFFKGVLYPITQIGSSQVDNFLLHALASIEGTLLTQAQIETLLGPEKVSRYINGTSLAVNHYNALVNTLAVENPYLDQGMTSLKSLNWEGVYSKFSPSIVNGSPEFELFSSEEFAAELDDLITDVDTIETTTLDTFTISAETLENPIEDTLTVKVQDNHIRQPLFSDSATITVQYQPSEQLVPTCGNTINKTIPHSEEYFFEENDFFSLPEEGKILIQGVASSGSVRLYNLPLTSSNYPVVVTREEIQNGILSYVPFNTLQESLTILYKTVYKGGYNACISNNTLEITKEESE